MSSDAGHDDVGYAPGLEHVDQPRMITNGRQTQVSLEGLSVTLLLPQIYRFSDLLPCLGLNQSSCSEIGSM